jgi:acetyltransferase
VSGSSERPDRRKTPLVRADVKTHRPGWLLMRMIIEYARAEGIRMIEAKWCARTVLKTYRELGFEIGSDVEEADVQLVRLRL